MNKIENFLNNLIEDGKIELSEQQLSCYFNNLELLIDFKRHNYSTDCILEITSACEDDIPFNCEFSFSIPCSHILKFLTFHTQSNYLNKTSSWHWLTGVSHSYVDSSSIIDPLYEKLIEEIKGSTVKAVKAKIFNNKLDKTLAIKADLPAKKPKI